MAEDKQGPADKLDAVWSPQPGPQALALTCPADIIFFGGARGGGKFLSNSSKILTPKGWITHGEVRRGDRVIDPVTGGAQDVVGVYPQGVVDIYRVRFDDGAEVDAGLEHLWAYKCAGRRRPGTKPSRQREFLQSIGCEYPKTRFDYFRVGTTEDLIAETEKGGSNPRIPLTNPVLFDVNGRTGKGKIPAYLVGLMLGDGHFPKKSKSFAMTTGDEETAEYLSQIGFQKSGVARCSNGVHREWIVSKSSELHKSLWYWANNHGLAGKSGKEKFIPEYVFTANVEYRLDVLRGLLDSDGYVDERGHVEFSNVSDDLVFGVRDLVRSFGGKATVSEPITGTYQNELGERVECQSYRRVYIYSNIASQFFTLSRKVKRCTDRWNGGFENMRKVVEITFSHREEATCIKVSSPHGLYITDGYVVTHNTDCAMGRQIRGAMIYGEAWSGLFVRKNFKHFKELRRRIDELINRGLDAKRSGGDQATNVVKFANGAQIIFTAIQYEAQLEYFQGQQYCELSIEEGCQFPFIDNMIEMLKGCLRSPHGVPTHMFITGNPGGPGHGQVKARFISPAVPGTPIKDAGGDICMFIPSSVEDNKILVQNDPKYVRMLKSIRNPELRKAWLEGDWDVVAGGFFSDLWQPHKLVLRPFRIPTHWDRVMGFDWGSAKPFSVGWWAISGGEFIPELGMSLPRGALVRYYEWYGCVKGQPDVGLRLNSSNVAKRILELEERYNLVPTGIIDRIADPAVFMQQDGKSVGESMAEEGVVFRRGDNKRVPGWDAMRSYMRGEEMDRKESVGENGETILEYVEYQPMMYVFETCAEFIRTVPILARDDHDYEDIDTTQEDHIADEVRYVCMSRQGKGTSDLDKHDMPTASEMDHAKIVGSETRDEPDLDPEMDLPANIDNTEIRWADLMIEQWND